MVMIAQNLEKVSGNLRQEILTAEKKPYVQPINYPGLPKSLKAFARWMPWRFVKKGGKWSKVPIDPANPSQFGSHSNPDHWMPFSDAMKMVASSTGSLDGLKIVPGEEITILDLDNALNPDKTPKPTVKKVLEVANTYCDISPTGTGCKLAFRVPYASLLERAELHGITRIESLVHKVEVPQEGWDCEALYGTKAACLTGYNLPGCPDEVNDDPDAFFDVWDLLYEDTLTQAAINEKRGAMVNGSVAITSKDIPLDVILGRAKAMSPKFKSLFNGDMSEHGEDHSVADMSLYSQLAFWIGPDPDRIKEAFSRSALYRDSKNDKYHDTTLGKVLADLNEVFDWKKADEKLKWLDDLEAQGPPVVEAPDITAGAKGTDGASACGKLDFDAMAAAEPPGAYEPTQADRDAQEEALYLKYLQDKGVKVVSLGASSDGPFRFLTDSCPCCNSHGAFIAERRTMKRYYNCSGKSGANWDAATAMWAGTKMKRGGFTIPELDKLPTPDWQVHNHWPENSLIMVYGPSGVYKSFLSADWGLSIASGRPFQGVHKVKQGPVAYVVGEGQGGVQKRLKAWLQKNEVDGNIPFVVIPYQFDLTNAGETEAMEILRIAQDKLGCMPSVVIVDTLNRHFGPGNENDTNDMSAFVKSCDLMRHETGGSVVVVHHTGRDSSRERGSIVLRSSCDVIISCDMYGDKKGVVVACEKQKDEDDFKPYLLLKEVRDIGNGITSLTLKLDDQWTKPKKEEKDKKTVWKDDEEVVLHFASVGEKNAWSKTKFTEQVQAELRSREADHIGEKRISLAIDTLVKRGKLRATEATNANHIKYYKPELATDTGFFLQEFITQEDDACGMACGMENES
jgi:hypothetical protein